MNQTTFIALTENGVFTTVIGFMLIPFLSSPLNAEQPAPKGCLAVYKTEYDSTKRQKLLRLRFAAYVRTGGLLKHYYWYCHS